MFILPYHKGIGGFSQQVFGILKQGNHIPFVCITKGKGKGGIVYILIAVDDGSSLNNSVVSDGSGFV